MPAPPYHPRDKAKVEVGVQVVQRWVLAALRKRQFFFTRGAERKHRRTDGQSEPAPIPETARIPAGTVRTHRPAGPQAIAGATICLRRVEESSCVDRLSRRSGAALLQRSLSIGGQTGGRSVHLRHGRDPVSRQASSLTPTQLPAWHSHYKRRTPAQIPSRVSGLDPSTYHRVGCHHRSIYRTNGRNDHE